MDSGFIATYAAGQEPEAHPPGLIPPSRRARSPKLIGDVIVELGFTSRQAVDAAVEASRHKGRTTG
jgi:hypothetical protein